MAAATRINMQGNERNFKSISRVCLSFFSTKQFRCSSSVRDALTRSAREGGGRGTRVLRLGTEVPASGAVLTHTLVGTGKFNPSCHSCKRSDEVRKKSYVGRTWDTHAMESEFSKLEVNIVQI